MILHQQHYEILFLFFVLRRDLDILLQMCMDQKYVHSNKSNYAELGVCYFKNVVEINASVCVYKGVI